MGRKKMLEQGKKIDWKTLAIIAVSLVFFVYLLMQYHQVFLYFDDFGYATLQYATPVSDGYTLSVNEYFIFLKQHYLGWSGRILYLALLVAFLNCPIYVIRCFFAICIVVIFFNLYKCAIGNNRNGVALYILLCSLYGTFGVEHVRECFYWFAAAILYITPIIPLLLFAKKYYSEEYDNVSNLKKFVIVILAFLSAFSQEQIAIISCCLSCALVYLKRRSIKNVRLSDFWLVSATFGGAAMEIAAPGNWQRLNNSQQSEWSVVKIFNKIKDIFAYFFSVNNKAYLLLFFMSMIILAMITIRAKKRKYQSIFMIILSSIGIGVDFYAENGIWSYLSNVFPEVFVVVLAMLYIFLDVYMIVMFYLESENLLPGILFVTALPSIAFLIFVPDLQYRSFVPFMLLSFSFFVDMFRYTFGIFDKKVMCVILLIIVSINLMEIGTVYKGYDENYDCNIYNDRILKKTAQEIEEGKEIKRIELRKLKDDKYAANMPYIYDNGITKAMRCYYNLPQDIQLQWEN